MNEIDRKAVAWLEGLCEELETDPDLIDALSPTEIREELREMGVNPQDLYQRIGTLLGQPIPEKAIPEKAILYLSDFRLRASSAQAPDADPLEPWFEFDWMLDHHLRLKLVLDLQEGKAHLEQSMGGEPYDAPLHWDESRREALEFLDSGLCFLKPEETQRLVVGLGLPSAYHQWANVTEAPTAPALLAKLGQLAQGAKAFLNQAQNQLLMALRDQFAGPLHAVLEELRADLRVQPALAYRSREATPITVGDERELDAAYRSRETTPGTPLSMPEVLVLVRARQQNTLDLVVDWGGPVPASAPVVEVEVDHVPLAVQANWQDGLQSLTLQAEGIGSHELALAWEWQAAEHRLRILVQTAAADVIPSDQGT